jgi:dinuclear metal center YbgI/SA1388 family protein
MTVKAITDYLESLFPLSYQESYDNSGLILGDGNQDCSGVLVCLDVTEAVVEEAINRKVNLIVAHHPLIFSGLKKLNRSGYLGRTVISAIKNDIAVYALHTNMDNMLEGVNGRIADRLGLVKRQILNPRAASLCKLVTFVPEGKDEQLRAALFATGAGRISAYDECSFNVTGTGTFRASEGTNPFVGNIGEQHHEREVRIEMVFPAHLESELVKALREAHPYEEVAFDVVPLQNRHPGIGSGLIGEVDPELSETELLHKIRNAFGLQQLKHTAFTGKTVKKIAICGGAGSFLITDALRAGADLFLSSDIKYHEFFGAEGRMLIADIGHYESEQFTMDLILELLQKKFSSFALLKTGINTNPVRYFPG